MEKEKKEEPLNEEIMRLTKQRTYLWCIVIIIGFFVVNQFALMFCSNRVMVEQFSFASTISSIILSVIAIIMSVVSGESINNLLHKFRDVHNEISDVPSKIESSTQKMDNASSKFDEIYGNLKDAPQKIEEATLLMTGASENIDNSIQNLHQIMTDFQEKTKDLQSLKTELKSEIREGFQSVESTTTDQDETEITLTNEQAIEVVKGSSPWGALFLYAIKRSKDESRYFSLDSFCRIFDIKGRRDYFYGYFVAMKATGIFEVKDKLTDKTEIIDYNHGLDAMKDYLPTCFPKNKMPERMGLIDKLIEKAPRVILATIE